MTTTQNRQRLKRASRGGFTLMEVLVAISVISVLLSLIAPGVLSARSAARKTECSNHLKNLAFAAANHEASGETLLLEDGTENGSWCRQLLPHLDLVALERSLNSSDPVQVAAALQSSPQIFRCPVDTFHMDVSAGLTYVANAGYIQNGYWWDSQDLAHTPDAYVSFSPAWPVTRTVSTGAVFRRTTMGRELRPVFGDGRSNTILLSENVQAGRWTSRFTSQIAFGVDVTLDRNNGDTLELGNERHRRHGRG